MKTYFKRDDEGIFRQNERPVKLNFHKKLSMKVKKREKVCYKEEHISRNRKLSSKNTSLFKSMC